jgi:hypothetical protein
MDFDPGPGVFNLTSSADYYGDYLPQIFVLKLDALGNFIWAKAFDGSLGGGLGKGISSNIAVDASGNIYTTGTFSRVVDFDPGSGVFYLTSTTDSDVFIFKLDSMGNFVWAKAIGAVSPNITTMSLSNFIAVDALGNVYTTGEFSYSFDFDPGAGVFTLTAVGGYNGFISKLNSLGEFVWAKIIGEGISSSHGSEVSPKSIALDTSDNIYTTGSFYGGVADFDPGVGVFNLIPGLSNDSFILKLDSSGNFVWAKQMVEASTQDKSDSSIGGSIKIDKSNNVYTAGYFSNTVDFDPGVDVFNLTSGGMFISKLNSNGDFIWAKSLGGASYGYTTCLDLDALGNIYIAGGFSDTADFDPGIGVFNLICPPSNDGDLFISKLNSNGDFVWAKAISGIGFENSLTIALDNANNVYLTGYFSSAIVYFDTLSLNNVYGSTDNIDSFIAKLSSSILGINEPLDNKNSMLIYPNPASNKIKLQFTAQYPENAVVKIFDMMGKIVFTRPYHIENDNLEMDVSGLTKGIYLLNIQSPEFSHTEKLIVTK